MGPPILDDMDDPCNFVIAEIPAVTSVKLPDFLAADPYLWFRQCDAAFRRSQVSSQGIIFNYVLMKL